MKKLLIIVLLSIFSISVFAHPAKNVNIEFDSKTKLLKVSFEHSVKNETKHFVDEFIVKVNKEEVITQLVSKQETKTGGEVVYKLIDVKAGDTIKVTTKCNKFGKKSAKLILK